MSYENEQSLNDWKDEEIRVRISEEAGYTQPHSQACDGNSATSGVDQISSGGSAPSGTGGTSSGGPTPSETGGASSGGPTPSETNGTVFYHVEPPKKKNKHSWPKKIALVVVCALLFGSVSGVTFYGVNRLLGGKEPDAEETSSVQLHTTSENAVATDYANSGITLDVRSIAKQVMPAMVSITNTSVQEVQNYFAFYFGMGGSTQQEVESKGSGIIIGENDSELLIATNNHVVEGSETLSVCFVDNQAYEAHIKGTDSDNDLAVIAVNKEDISADTMGQISIAKIGDSAALEVGEQVVAIGNALGYGQSVTTGIVSAVNRQIDTTDAALIQTDAAINPGNSGGALLNMQGQVVGINSAKFSSTEVEGMGYAISMEAATPIIEDLMNRQTREKVAEDQASYLGIYGEDVSSEMETAYGIPQGIYVAQLVENGPAAQAGLGEKSIITKFDGTRIKTMSELKEQLTYYAAGETVELTIQVPQGSEYVEQTLMVTLGAAKDAETTQSQQNQNSQQGNGFLGGFGR